jgi:hypothetical protein
MKALVLILSIGLAVLGGAGVISATTLWLAWLDLGIAAAGIATVVGVFGEKNDSESGIAAAAGVCVGLLGMIRLATGHHGWLAWSNLAFGIALFVVAAVDAMGYRRLHAEA